MKRFKELIDNVAKKPTDLEETSISFVHHHHASSNVNPIIDHDLIRHIDPDYFKSQTDPKLNELKSLPGNVAVEVVEAKRNVLCNQLAAVTKKLSDAILDHQPSYAKELTRVQELQQSLHNAFIICSNGRRYLNTAKTETSEVDLLLLSNHKKLKQLCALLDALRTIKTLQNTDIRLREMLQEEEYDDAVQLCLECKQVASTYRQYNCIKDLTSKLQDTLEQTEEQIDVALSRTCFKFDQVMYEKLQSSYKLLGKSQAASDQLLMHYTTCIHNVAVQVVARYNKINEKQDSSPTTLNSLCARVDRNDYLECLVELCKNMWKIMFAYHCTMEWHHKQANSDVYVMGRLKHGRARVWNDVQLRVKNYFISTNLNSFKYDQFIVILDLVKRFIRGGVDFVTYGNSASSKGGRVVGGQLQEALNSQTLAYFTHHHKSATDELIMFIENESWQPVPLKNNFTVFNMQEFKFLQLRAHYESAEASTNAFVAAPAANDDDDGGGKNTEACSDDDDNYLSQFTQADKTPFDDFIEESKKLNKKEEIDYVEQLSDDDEDEDVIGDYIEPEDQIRFNSNRQSDSLSPSSSPTILTNSALHVLRLCGNYMKMADALQSISVDVAIAMCELYEIYFHSIVSCFSSYEKRKQCRCERLEAAVRGIKQNLFNAKTHENSGGLLREADMSSTDVNNPKDLYAVQHRVVALQSLGWLSEQFNLLRTRLDEMMNSNQNKKPLLNHFFSQTINLYGEVEWVILHEVVSRLPMFKCVTQNMMQLDWNVDEIMTQHNSYVDTLLADIADFKQKLFANVNSDSVQQLPDHIEKCVWKQVIFLSNHAFVEGFSTARTCSNEGRALMQLDYQQFLNKLEKITNIRPTPNREHVEWYIKAFYMIEADLMKWMSSSSSKNKYETRQLEALLQLVTTTSSSSASSSLASASSAVTSAIGGGKNSNRRQNAALNLITQLTNANRK